MEASTCLKCNFQEHKIYACSKMDELAIEQRLTFVNAKFVGMCRESVNASLAIFVATLCYMQIFLVRKPLSLWHTHEMMKCTFQALSKDLRSHYEGTCPRTQDTISPPQHSRRLLAFWFWLSVVGASWYTPSECTKSEWEGKYRGRPAGRLHAKKVSSDQINLVTLY